MSEDRYAALRNNPVYRAFKAEEIPRYSVNPPTQRTLIAWINQAELYLQNSLVPEESWLLLLSGRFRDCTQIMDRSTVFMVEYDTNSPDSWTDFKKVLMREYFPMGTDLFYYQELLHPDNILSSATGDYRAVALARAHIINYLEEISPQVKLHHFLAGFVPEAIEYVRLRFPALPDMDYDQVREVFQSIAGTVGPTAAIQRLTPTANRNGRNNRNRNNRRPNRNTDSTGTNPINRPGRNSLEEAKAEWIRRNRPDCGWCTRARVPTDQRKHFYRTCERNPNRPTVDVNAFTASYGFGPLEDTYNDYAIGAFQGSSDKVLDLEESDYVAPPEHLHQSCKLSTCRLKGHTFSSLLDTGSPVNLISPHTVSRLNLTVSWQPDPLRLSSAMHYSRATAVNKFVSIHIKGISFRFYVVDISYDAIYSIPSGYMVRIMTNTLYNKA